MRNLFEQAAAGLQSRFAKVKSDLRSEVDEAAARLNAHLVKTAAQAAAWLAVSVLLIVAIAFATFAGYQALLVQFPVVAAAALVAGVYAVLALVAALIALSIGKQPPVRLNESQRDALAEGEATASAAPAGADAGREPPAGDEATTTSSLKLEASVVADLLGALGRSDEQAALLIAAEVAKSLSPVQLIAAGLVSGFALGRKIKL